MGNLLSPYQNSLLDCMFLASAKSRTKVNVMMAESISPLYPAERYYDRGPYENEMKQVIGDTEEVHQIDENFMLFVGTAGLILIGPQSTRFEKFLVSYVTLRSMKIFHEFFYQRVIYTQETLKRIRSMIEIHEEDPNSVRTIRALHSSTENDVILLQEILIFLRETLERLSVPECPSDDPRSPEFRLWHALKLNKALDAMKRRVGDMDKNIHSAQHELECLHNGVVNIESFRMFQLSQEVRDNTKNVEDVFKSNERASNSLEMMEVILSGTLAFEILDRLTGEWSVVEQPWAKKWIVEPLIEVPLAWFVVNIALWALIGFCLTRFMRYLGDQALQVLTITMKLNVKVATNAVERYLATKEMQEESTEMTSEAGVRKIHWEETDKKLWNGTPPEIDMHYDFVHGFLLSLQMTFKKAPNMVSERRLKQIMIDDLTNHGVFVQKISSYWSKAPLLD